MKAVVAVLAGMFCALCARAEIVFQGYMTTPSRPLFVVSVDKEKTSGWLALGQSFDGVSVVSFDAQTELLTVEQEGRRRTLHLVEGKVRSGGDASNKVAVKPIVISIGGQETISVGNDAAMLEALRVKFTQIAALSPQPVVTLRAPGDATMDRLRVIMDLCRTTGIKRFSISTP